MSAHCKKSFAKRKINTAAVTYSLTLNVNSHLWGQSELRWFQNADLQHPHTSDRSLCTHPALRLILEGDPSDLWKVSVFCNGWKLQLLQAVELSLCREGSASNCTLRSEEFLVLSLVSH